MSHSSDASPSTPALRINPGFVLGQLARALTLAAESPDPALRARSAAKAVQWQTVMEGIRSGALGIGSRTPVAGAPAWATLKVVKGGFATGELLAEGPLSPHEQAWLKALGPEASHRPRAALNAYFLSEEGLAWLGDMLDTGAYRVDVPEEGALLVAAWLLRHGSAEQARALLEELAPFFSRLRFYPAPHAPSTEDGLRVHLQSVAETVDQLKRVRLPLDLQRERESAEVWTPLYDELVQLFLETCTSEGACRDFPAAWCARGSALLGRVTRARTKHLLCKWPHQPKSHFSKLCDVLAQAVKEPASLTPGHQRRVQHVLDDITRARGLPGSERLRALRAEQQRVVSRPTHADLARVLVARLAACSSSEGLDDLEQVTAPVAVPESSQLGVAAGAELPASLLRKLVRCANTSLEELIARKVVTSSEVLARVLPQVSAHVAAQGVNAPELRRLYGHIYAAFRRRRSLLLLDLQAQVKLRELPWVRAIDAHRTPNLGQQEVAAQTLERIASLAISAFPEVLIPNKLLQEFRALAQAAGLKIPLVEELAADIFMNAFSPKFDEAARHAAVFVQGSLYARYYDIPTEPLLRPGAVRRSRASRQHASAFAQRCLARAQAEGQQPRGVSGNGMIIEQAQILTTHNLAILFDTLGLTRTLRPRLPELARHCFERVCQLLLRNASHYQHRLRNVKNAAYAWRQMVFFLSLLPKPGQEDFGHWAQQRLDAQPHRIAASFAPALTRLLAAIEAHRSPLPGRVFLGWAVGSHWLLQAQGGVSSP